MCGLRHLQLELLLQEKQQVLQTQDAIQDELRQRVALQSDLERQLGELLLCLGQMQSFIACSWQSGSLAGTLCLAV